MEPSKLADLVPDQEVLCPVIPLIWVVVMNTTFLTKFTLGINALTDLDMDEFQVNFHVLMF